MNYANGYRQNGPGYRNNNRYGSSSNITSTFGGPDELDVKDITIDGNRAIVAFDLNGVPDSTVMSATESMQKRFFLHRDGEQIGDTFFETFEQAKAMSYKAFGKAGYGAGIRIGSDKVKVYTKPTYAEAEKQIAYEFLCSEHETFDDRGSRDEHYDGIGNSWDGI